MPKERNLEVKVGLFVLVAVVSATIFIWSITDNSVFQKGKTLQIVFGFANGLKKNAPVRIAGVDEGIVKDVFIFFDRKDGRTKAEVAVSIGKNTKIPVDSTVTINQLGLLGEKYIEIIPGIDTESFFEDGQRVTGKDPIPQRAISEKVLHVAKKVEESIGGINKIINDEENQLALKNTIEGIGSASRGLSELIDQANSGEGTIGKLFYDSKLYENIEGLTADLKENPWKLLYRSKDKKKR